MNAQVYNGNVFLNTQAEVDSFGTLGYQEITDNLIIGTSRYSKDSTDILSLNALYPLTKVKSLEIRNNPYLTSFQGLELIDSLQVLTLSNNASIKDFHGFEGLKYVRNLAISNFDSLSQVLGFDSLTSVYFLELSHSKIVSLEGAFPQLKNVQSWIKIYNNDSLMTLEGFLPHLDSLNFGLELNCLPIKSIGYLSNFEYIKELNLIHNSKMSDLRGMPRLSAVRLSHIPVNNLDALKDQVKLDHLTVSGPSFTSLKGIENIEQIDDFYLQETQVGSLAQMSEFINFDLVFLSENHHLRSLEGLHQVRRINKLFIIDNDSLKSLIGLRNLLSTNTIKINENDALLNLEGLDHLENVEELMQLHYNRGMGETIHFPTNVRMDSSRLMVSANTFNNLVFTDMDLIDELFITHNNVTNLGIEGLQKVNYLLIEKNINLTKIDLSSLKECGLMRIQNNGRMDSVRLPSDLKMNSTLNVHNNATLKHVGGLEHLKTNGGFGMHFLSNDSLHSVDLLDSVTSSNDTIALSNITFFLNPLLTSITMLNNVENVGEFGVFYSPSLVDLNVLTKAKRATEINLYRVGSLRELNCFTQIRRIDKGLELLYADQLVDVNSFFDLKSVDVLKVMYNPKLNNLNWLKSLESCSKTTIEANPQLNECCLILNFLEGDDNRIIGNGENCTRYYLNESCNPPRHISLTGDGLYENSTFIGNLSTIDHSLNDLHYYTTKDSSVIEIYDDSLFSIKKHDFEQFRDSLEFTIRVTDSGGLFIEQLFKVAILDVDETDSTSLVLNSSPNISIYPNPAFQLLNLKSIVSINSFELLDEKGVTLISKQFENPTKNTTLNVSNIRSGVYQLNVKLSNDKYIIRKILIRK